MNPPGRLFVISAPSGTGKTTVVHALLTSHPELVESISYTTRSPRRDERNGVDYHFVDEKTFRRLIDERFFAEWATVHGFYYGTPRKFIEEAIAVGKDVVLDIDVQGGMNLKKQFPHAVTIFLLPPSEAELTRRLTGRGTEAASQIEERLKNAHEEMTYQDRYEHCVVNDDVDRAAAEIASLMGLNG